MNAITSLPNATHQQPFFQVPRTRVQTSEGAVDLPIMYYDTSMLNAYFLVDKARVEKILQGTGLVPALTIGGKALVALACFEYRDTSVGVYNEVGVALAVTRQGDTVTLGGWQDVLTTISHPEERHVGFHIIDLPVTTAAANAAGREIWGYPKFVTAIPFSLKKHQFDCQVMIPDGSGTIMKLSGRIGASMGISPLSLTLLSLRKGEMIRATVNVRGASRLAMAGSLKLSVPDSSHPMAQRLNLLGLDGEKPIAVSWTHDFQSRLNGGVVI